MRSPVLGDSQSDVRRWIKNDGVVAWRNFEAHARRCRLRGERPARWQGIVGVSAHGNNDFLGQLRDIVVGRGEGEFAGIAAGRNGNHVSDQRDIDRACGSGRAAESVIAWGGVCWTANIVQSAQCQIYRLRRRVAEADLDFGALALLDISHKCCRRIARVEGGKSDEIITRSDSDGIGRVGPKRPS